MPEHLARGNAWRARIHAPAEHVFAEQKQRLGLIIRSIGLARAKARIALANLTYMRRLAWLDRRAVPA